MRSFGYSVPSGVNLQPPLQSVDNFWRRVDDPFTQLTIILEDITELVELRDQLVTK